MKQEHTGLARRLRREQTSTEKQLWHDIRNRKLGGMKFRRQQPFGSYVLDFYCAEAKLNANPSRSQATPSTATYNCARITMPWARP